MHDGVARVLLGNDDAPLLRNEISVDDIDTSRRGYPLRETSYKRRVERLRVRDIGDLALIDQVERLVWLLIELGVEVAHLLHQVDEGLEFTVFLGENDWRVDGGAGE